MIWGQVIWGAVLSALLGYTFRRAWRWEHGGAVELLFPGKYGRETFVLVPPTALFWILAALMAAMLARRGVQDGFACFAALAAEALLTLSVYDLVLLALLPLLRRHISARACAVLWLVPVFLFYQGHVLLSTLPLPRRTLYIPRGALPAVCTLWLAGFLAVGGYYLISHLAFRAQIMRRTYPERDAAVLALWEKVRGELDYRRPTALLRGDVAAPFSMGETNRSRCTVLPKRAYTPEELTMIFRHEVHHLQRVDVNTKIFLCLCRAACWFNPLVWLAARSAADDLERSCDEIVTEDMDASQRRVYARLLLDAAAPVRGCTTCLSAAAGTLRYRIKGVMEAQRRHLGTALLMAALFCCTLSFGAVAVSDARGSFTALLLPEGTEIQAVYPSQTDARGISLAAAGWDDAALRKALDGVALEHVADLRAPAIQSRRRDARLTLSLPGDRFVTLTPVAVIVTDVRGGSDCYLVRGAVDWDAILSAVQPET